MEAIVEMAQLDKGRFLVASLPAPHQLDMHVDAKQFLSLTNT